MSHAEDLAFEPASETRYEFRNGEVLAMVGGTITHGGMRRR